MALACSGTPATTAVSSPASTTRPLPPSTSADPAGGSAADDPETNAGSRARTWTVRRAATRARVALSAASVTVRTGSSRKAA